MWASSEILSFEWMGDRRTDEQSQIRGTLSLERGYEHCLVMNHHDLSDHRYIVILTWKKFSIEFIRPIFLYLTVTVFLHEVPIAFIKFRGLQVQRLLAKCKKIMTTVFHEMMNRKLLLILNFQILIWNENTLNNAGNQVMRAALLKVMPNFRTLFAIFSI